MSKVRDRDEQEALKLDEHFKRTLMRVRPHILNLTSLEEARLCGIWLEKLNCTTSQRNLRNEYLLELFRQLKTGTLEGIFKSQPTGDSLMPLPLSCYSVCISSSLSELSDYGKKRQNSLVLNKKLDKQKHLRSKIKCGSDPTYMDKIERNYLNIDKYYINILITALKNFQTQNERLKQELTKCQEQMKDNDVFQLQNYIKQLTQTQDQNLTWEVKALKRTIIKLKKLNSSIERIYEKKLDRIIRYKNLEIKALQLHFQEKTSELCLSLHIEKQKELHNLIECLEERYKALLAAADIAFESQRQEYFTKIAAHEAELRYLKNNSQRSSI